MSQSPGRQRNLIYAVLFYVAVTFLITYPVGIRLASHLAGVPGEDALQHLWISWWTQKSLIDLGTSPAQADWLYYPDGAMNPMLWVTPYPQVVGLPLSLFLGAVPAYNIHLLLSFVLAGLSAYLLTLYLTRNRWAALLGGLVFALFPNRVVQSTAHFAQMTTYWFPLCALYLIKLRRQPGPRNALLFGLLLALSLLVNIVHIAYLVLPLLAVFLGYWAIAEYRSFWKGRTLGYLALGLAFGGFLSAPFLVPFVWHSFTGQLGYLSQEGVNDFSADLLAFFVPAASHPILSQWPAFREMAGRLIGTGSLRENTVYLGIVPLILSAWGLWRNRKTETMPWLLLVLGAGILSLGPALKLAGERTGWPMPYALVQYLPFYKWGRIPGRFNETIILGLVVLMAYGYACLARRLKGRQPLCLAAVLLVCIGFEYLTVWPFPTMTAATPALYREWAKDRQDWAVLDLPQWPIWVRQASNYAMFYQTVHEHKIVGGYVWRLPQHRDGTMKAFQELFWPDGATDIITRRRGQEAIPLLNQYGIRYVVVHRDTLPPEDQEADVATVVRALGLPLYDSPEVVAFAVPQSLPPSPAEPLTAFSYNWYMVEPIDGKPARWLKNDGTLYVHLLKTGDTSYRLTFDAAPFRQPRHLQVSLDGKALTEAPVNGPQTVEIGPLFLHQGQNEISFHVSEGCDVPAEVSSGSEDRRCLSLVFQEMKLSPIAEKTP